MDTDFDLAAPFQGRLCLTMTVFVANFGLHVILRCFHLFILIFPFSGFSACCSFSYEFLRAVPVGGNPRSASRSGHPLLLRLVLRAPILAYCDMLVNIRQRSDYGAGCAGVAGAGYRCRAFQLWRRGRPGLLFQFRADYQAGGAAFDFLIQQPAAAQGASERRAVLFMLYDGRADGRLFCVVATSFALWALFPHMDQRDVLGLGRGRGFLAVGGADYGGDGRLAGGFG